MVDRSDTGPVLLMVARPDEVPAALGRLGLHPPRPVLVLVGGAAGMDDQHQEGLRRLLDRRVLGVLEEVCACVVDGGTFSGVMRVIGEVVADAGSDVPLLGVAARGTVIVPGQEPPQGNAADLDPNHTAVILVPGHDWGDESRWIDTVAKTLAGTAPRAVLLVNGGEIAFTDVRHAVDSGVPVVALAGSGRSADSIAAAVRGEDSDPRAAALAASGIVHALDMQDGPGLAGRLMWLLRP